METRVVKLKEDGDYKISETRREKMNYTDKMRKTRGCTQRFYHNKEIG